MIFPFLIKITFFHHFLFFLFDLFFQFFFFNLIYNLSYIVITFRFYFPPIAYTIEIGALYSLCCIYVLLACIIIEKKWDSLESYFLSNFYLDYDLTENDPDEKPTREKKLVNALKQTVSKLYAMFFQSVIPIFDKFHTFLQSQEPLI